MGYHFCTLRLLLNRICFFRKIYVFIITNNTMVTKSLHNSHNVFLKHYSWYKDQIPNRVSIFGQVTNRVKKIAIFGWSGVMNLSVFPQGGGGRAYPQGLTFLLEILVNFFILGQNFHTIFTTLGKFCKISKQHDFFKKNQALCHKFYTVQILSKIVN